MSKSPINTQVQSVENPESANKIDLEVQDLKVGDMFKLAGSWVKVIAVSESPIVGELTIVVINPKEKAPWTMTIILKDTTMFSVVPRPSRFKI